jgi:hypothetical protein
MRNTYKVLIGIVAASGLYVGVGGPIVHGSVKQELEKCGGTSVEAKAWSNVYGGLFNVEADLFQDGEYVSGLALSEKKGEFSIDIGGTIGKMSETGGILENLERGIKLKDALKQEGCIAEISDVVGSLR